MQNKNIPGVLFVGDGVQITGSIDAPTGVINAGKINGIIKTEKLLIEMSGSTEGAVIAQDLDVAGEIKNCDVNVEHLVIRSNGSVIGNIVYNQMGIEKGGQISGTISTIKRKNINVEAIHLDRNMNSNTNDDEENDINSESI